MHSTLKATLCLWWLEPSIHAPYTDLRRERKYGLQGDLTSPTSYRYLSSSTCFHKKTCKLRPERKETKLLPCPALSSEFWNYQVFPKGYRDMLLQMNRDPVSREGLGGVSVKCHRCEGEWRTKEKPSRSKCEPSSKKDDKWPNQVFNWKESKEVSLGTETF